MNGTRRLPLKIAGVLGVFSAAFHVAVMLGAGAAPKTLLAIGWMALMFVAGVLAWIAPDAPARGRRLAALAAGLFFVVGLPAIPFFIGVFLVALVLTIMGFAGAQRPDATDQAS